MRMVTPIGRVRGLGSAKSGAHHWWLERVTSVSTLLLSVWFAVALLRLPALDHETVSEWLRSPLALAPMLLFIVSTFWHLKLGLQVVIEDYVHEEGLKLFSIVLLNFAILLVGAVAVLAALMVAYGEGAA